MTLHIAPEILFLSSLIVAFMFFRNQYLSRKLLKTESKLEETESQLMAKLDLADSEQTKLSALSKTLLERVKELN